MRRTSQRKKARERQQQDENKNEVRASAGPLKEVTAAPPYVDTTREPMVRTNKQNKEARGDTGVGSSHRNVIRDAGPQIVPAETGSPLLYRCPATESPSTRSLSHTHR
ncbi:hypothetical protein MRX96_008339 [Rhipicephalus microplus]